MALVPFIISRAEGYGMPRKRDPILECWLLVLWFVDYLLRDLVGSFWTLQCFGHIKGLKLRLNNVQGVTTCLGDSCN